MKMIKNAGETFHTKHIQNTFVYISMRTETRECASYIFWKTFNSVRECMVKHAKSMLTCTRAPCTPTQPSCHAMLAKVLCFMRAYALQCTGILPCGGWKALYAKFLKLNMLIKWCLKPGSLFCALMLCGFVCVCMWVVCFFVCVFIYTRSPKAKLKSFTNEYEYACRRAFAGDGGTTTRCAHGTLVFILFKNVCKVCWLRRDLTDNSVRLWTGWWRLKFLFWMRLFGVSVWMLFYLYTYKRICEGVMW